MPRKIKIEKVKVPKSIRPKIIIEGTKIYFEIYGRPIEGFDIVEFHINNNTQSFYSIGNHYPIMRTNGRREIRTRLDISTLDVEYRE